MSFCAFTPSMALIQREATTKDMRSTMMAAMSRNDSGSERATLCPVAMSMASFVAHTKPKSTTTRSRPARVLSRAWSLW